VVFTCLPSGRNRDRASGVSEPETSLSSSEADGEEDSEDGRIKPFGGARQDNGVDSDASLAEGIEALEGDDFIVEDDGVVPAELPVDFSMSTHQDLAHHFKIICQFFVHLAVRLPAERGSVMEESMQGKHMYCPLS
jgi:hypothetical protein